MAIVALLASIALPMTELAVKRSKESELRSALHQIRGALDSYKANVESGHIAHGIGESGYPKSLQVLVEGAPDLLDVKGRKIYFLRRIPRDPMHGDTSVPAGETWGKRSYASPPDDPQEGEDVFDVYSLSDETGLNGIAYKDW